MKVASKTKTMTVLVFDRVPFEYRDRFGAETYTYRFNAARNYVGNGFAKTPSVEPYPGCVWHSYPRDSSFIEEEFAAYENHFCKLVSLP